MKESPSDRLDVGFYRYSLLNRGGDRMVVEYANHLAAEGHGVTFHLTRNETVFTLHPGVRRATVPWPGPAGFLAYGACHRFPHDLVLVDIIHLPLLLGLRNQVVYFAQADDVEYYGGKLGRLAMDLLYRAYLRPGAAAITVDARLSRIFAERYGFTASRTVTNGIDRDTFFPEPDPALIEQKGSRRAVVFMARGDHYRKGYDLALEVFRTVDVATGGQMELWVCGNRLAEREFPFPVYNFGVVSDARLRQILSSADLFFYPSRHEGFGLFPLEAMACGCAVLTTEAVPYAKGTEGMVTVAIGATREMVDQLRRLVGDRTVLADLREAGRPVAARYDLARSKAQFLQALRDIRNEQRR